MLRAGLFGRAPLARRTIARRLGLSLRRTLRVERAGIEQLTGFSTCIKAGGAALGTSLTSVPASADLLASEAIRRPAENRKAGHRGRDRQAVLGATESYTPLPLPGRSEDAQGTLNTLMAFLAVLAALLLVVLHAPARRQLTR